MENLRDHFHDRKIFQKFQEDIILEQNRQEMSAKEKGDEMGGDVTRDLISDRSILD